MRRASHIDGAPQEVAGTARRAARLHATIPLEAPDMFTGSISLIMMIVIALAVVFALVFVLTRSGG
jgi:hypothetical protein